MLGLTEDRLSAYFDDEINVKVIEDLRGPALVNRGHDVIWTKVSEGEGVVVSAADEEQRPIAAA